MQHLSVKIFAQPGAELNSADAIAVFHRWIQRGDSPEMMIDVADYSHVHDGPGAVPLPSRRDWPRRSEWLSEAGVGLSWRPGLPDPLAVLQVEYAIPIGADGRNTRVSVAFHRVVNLLPAR